MAAAFACDGGTLESKSSTRLTALTQGAVKLPLNRVMLVAALTVATHVSCATSPPPRTVEAESMTLEEATWWLEANLEPMTGTVTVEATRGVVDVTVRYCWLRYTQRVGSVYHDRAIPLWEVWQVQVRSTNLDVATVELRWLYVKGRDPEEAQLNWEGEEHLAGTMFRFVGREAKRNAEETAQILQRAADLCIDVER